MDISQIILSIMSTLVGGFITWVVAESFYRKTSHGMRLEIQRARRELVDYTQDADERFQQLRSSLEGVTGAVNQMPIEAERMVALAERLPEASAEVARRFEQQTSQLSEALRSEISSLGEYSEEIRVFTSVLKNMEEKGVEVASRVEGNGERPVLLLFARESLVKKAMYAMAGGALFAGFRKFVGPIADAVAERIKEENIFKDWQPSDNRG